MTSSRCGTICNLPCWSARISPCWSISYISGKELEVDAVCDGEDVYIPGIMQHVERTGVHSGDSISVYPPFSLSAHARETILDYTVQPGVGHRHPRAVQHSVHRR